MPPTWKVEIKMTLGTEKQSYSGSVDLGGHVSEVMLGMATVLKESTDAIRTAHDTILKSASPSLAARSYHEKKQREKNGGRQSARMCSEEKEKNNE